jgi:hypothetical protein
MFNIFFWVLGLFSSRPMGWGELVVSDSLADGEA